MIGRLRRLLGLGEPAPDPFTHAVVQTRVIVQGSPSTRRIAQEIARVIDQGDKKQ